MIAANAVGYDVDISCFRAWANRMAERGPADFYDPLDPFASCDYPPAYMLILWAVGLIGKAAGTGATEFMVKVPPILADIALCAVLYREAKKQKLSGPAALAFMALYALNPLVIVTGAAWGQADALMTLFLVLTVLYAVRGQWKAALPFYIVSVLFKPQALMFGPLGLLALGMHIVYHWKDETARKAVLRDVGLGLAAIGAVLGAVLRGRKKRSAPPAASNAVPVTPPAAPTPPAAQAAAAAAAGAVQTAKPAVPEAPGKRGCAACGAALAPDDRTCPYCGRPFSVHDRNCPHCGKRIGERSI